MGKVVAWTLFPQSLQHQVSRVLSFVSVLQVTTENEAHRAHFRPEVGSREPQSRPNEAEIHYDFVVH